VEVLVTGATEEPLETERPAHAHGTPERVGVVAHDRQGVEGPDRRAGDDDLDVVGSAVGADGRHHLVADEFDELPEHPRQVGTVPFLHEHRPAADAVARVHLDAAGGDQWHQGIDDQEALDLLCVAARSREHEHRSSPVTPTGDLDLAIET
jgi:hypothetical protein